MNSSPPRRARKAAAAGGSVQAPGHVLQHPVAETVAERIVDGLEVVDVDEQQRQLLGGAGARECRRQTRRQLPPVGQLRQRIVMRQVVQLARALGDVLLELGLVGAQLGLRVRDALRPWC